MEKGKLKIFFGYSAGVGKTYAMLMSAHELLKSGADVVIGYVEPHARPETIKLTEGFESIELKKIDYKGIWINEFDVDKAISRKPEIILVDELAHANAATSKHKKRYQDVLELLNNGINVYTTVNVQHLEGLNDVIDNATSVKVGETVPDEIFDRADEVELIDIEPNELVERLRSGKVYHGERINTALEHFFTEEHLNNLREVSMRRCADRIVKQTHFSEVMPRVLVLISPSPSSQKNIRIAAQMASNYHCKFSAMYVERSGELDDESAKNLKAHIKLVSDLEGEVVIKYGDSIVETIETYVKLNGITNIIIGKTWQSIGKKVGLEEQIITALPDIEVLIVPDIQSGASKRKSNFSLAKHDKIYIILFTLILAGISCIFWANSLVAFIALAIGVTFLFVCFILERKHRTSLSWQFKQSNRVLDCMTLLTAKSDSADKAGAINSIASILTKIFMRSVQITVDGKTVVKAYNNENCDFFSSSNELVIQDWCHTNNMPSGKGTDTLRSSLAIYYPLLITKTSIAVIAFSCKDSKLTVTDKMLFSQIKNTISLLLK